MQSDSDTKKNVIMLIFRTYLQIEIILLSEVRKLRMSKIMTPLICASYTGTPMNQLGKHKRSQET